MLFKDQSESEDQGKVNISKRNSLPFPELVRPDAFDDIKGQDSIWKPGAALRVLAETDRFYSLIFWGPPGTGKTSVARLIGTHSSRKICFLSAVNAGVKDIRTVLTNAESLERAPVLFMDEVHRLSKNQQDVLLPALEDGQIKFIGATTENPSFEVNHAVLSRSLVFRFEKISSDQMEILILQALEKSHSSHKSRPKLSAKVIEILANGSGGDARRALNLLDAVLAICGDKNEITPEDLIQLRDSLPLLYDKSGDQHYDSASAMIKSIRGSHPDAALYYLARMLEGGETPEFIARRLVISASEDIGNANPHALSFANAAARSVEMLGMPEARIVLGQICTFLAASPKSNRSYLAMDKALACVRKTGPLEIPFHLRNAPTEMMKSFGYGKNYAYAHGDQEGAKQMTYLPDELKGTTFYEPGDSGYEKNIRQVLSELRPHAD